MKCIVYSKDFKSLADRVSLNQLKNTCLPILNYIKLTAENDRLTAEGTDVNSYIKVEIPANVIEAGSVIVNIDKLKKVSNITTDNVIVETFEDGNIRISGAKKKYETVCSGDSSELDNIFTPFLDAKNRKQIAVYDENLFVSNLGRIDCCRDDNEANTLMLCFNLDTVNNRLTTLDGHRIGTVEMKGIVKAEDDNINICGTAYKILKGLQNKAKGRNILILGTDKYLWFIGEDYEYSVKRVEGKYFDIARMMNTSDFTERFTVNVKELKAIAKEYAKALPKDDKAPMLMYRKDMKLLTAIQTPDYRTVDELEESKCVIGSDEFVIGLNPRYIVDAMGMFDGDVQVVAKGERAPMLFSDDECTCLVLPVNITGDKFVDYVKKIVA